MDLREAGASRRVGGVACLRFAVELQRIVAGGLGQPIGRQHRLFPFIQTLKGAGHRPQ